MTNQGSVRPGSRVPGEPLSSVPDRGQCTFVGDRYWDNATTYARIFDFGSNDVAFMALGARDVQGKILFMTTRVQSWCMQFVTGDALPTGRWVHVAVTLSGTVGTLYVDGSPVASQDDIWITPYQLGHTTQNWLGRSQISRDPFFKGRMQDLRVYNGALDAPRIAELAR
jgi:hypothetical protein